MTQPLTSTQTGNRGIWKTADLVESLGWYFRPQPFSDVGIDATVEPRLGGYDSGRLIALQIKAGASAFKSPQGLTGWTYYFDAREAPRRDYWINYSVPVLLILCNVESGQAFWQLIDDTTAVRTTVSFKVFVPAAQRVDAANAPELARLAKDPPRDYLAAHLRALPDACAASLAELDVTDPVLARRIAIALAGWTDDPCTALDSVALSAPETDFPSRAWEALADFAHEHCAAGQASTLFERAAQCCRDPVRRRRLLAFAALLIADTAPAASRALFEEVLVDDPADLLCAIGVAALNIAHAGAPVPIPQAILDNPEASELDPTVQRFLAEQQLRQGHLREALRLHQKALDLAPFNPRQQLAVAEVMVRIAEPAGGVSQSEYCRQAVSLAFRARTTLRRWRADSRKAAEVLLLAHQVGGDEQAALRVAMAEPEGDGNPREASAPAVAFHGARIAYETGKIDLGDRFGAIVAAAQEPVWTAYWTAVQADHCESDSDRRVQCWRRLVDAGADGGILLVALNALAGLGQWPLSELDDLRRQGRLAPGSYELVHARAQRFAGDVTGALRSLRSCYRRNVIAAEEYARLLAEQGEIDLSIEVCDDTALTFGDNRLSLLALDTLNAADRRSEAIRRAHALLGDPNLPFGLRSRIRGKLMSAHIAQQNWHASERLAMDGYAESDRHLKALDVHGFAEPLPTAEQRDIAQVRSDFSWLAISSQLNRGQIDRAVQTLRAHDPAIGEEFHARTWCDLHRLTGWTAEAASSTIGLIALPFVSEHVKGQLLFSLVETCRPRPDGPTDSADRSGVVWLDRQLHQRILDAWRTHVSDSQDIRVAASPDVRAVSDLQDVQSSIIDGALSRVWNGLDPIGSISETLKTFYALTICQGLAGFIPASHADAQVQDLEVQCARQAMSSEVVCETTALYLLTGHPKLWEQVRSSIHTVIVSQDAVRDLLSSHAAARSLSVAASHPYATPSTGLLGTTESNDTRATQAQDVLVRTGLMLEAIQQCRVHPIEIRPDGARESAENPTARTPWQAATHDASSEGVPLLSDDVVLRDNARAGGGTAFGTLALVEALIQQYPDAIDLDDVGRYLFLSRVVDLPNIAALVVHAAGTPEGDRGVARLNLARPQFWIGMSDEDEFAGVIAAVSGTLQPDNHEQFVATVAAMSSGLLAYSPTESTAATLCTIAIVHGTGFFIDPMRIVIETVADIAAKLGLAPTEQMRAMLTAACDDPSLAALIPPNALSAVEQAFHPSKS